MTKIVVIFGFLVAFAAGLVVGLERRPAPPAHATGPATTRASGPRGFLPAALNLTPEQQAEMKKIWDDASGPGPASHDQREKRDKARKERDDQLMALLSPEQKTQYEEIQKSYREKNDAIDRDLRADFQRRVEETNKILTPEQQAKYQELLAHRQQFDRGDRGPRDRGDRGFRDSNRRGDDRATSQPRPQT